MASADGLLSDVRVAFRIGSPGTLKKIEQLSDISIPTLTSDKVDTTTYGQRYKRSIPGLKDVNDMAITCLRDPKITSAPNQNALFAMNASGIQVWWRVEIHADTDATVDLWEAYEFEGRVGSFEPAATIGDKEQVVSNVAFSGTSFSRFEPAASQIG